ncbi:MAG: asparagine--tRNA ligase [Akkermansia sp.]
MEQRTLIKHTLTSQTEMPHITIMGWIRTRRDSKTFSFLEVNDGTSLASLQIIADADIPGYDQIPSMNTGAAVCIQGDLVSSPGKQKWELRATSLHLVGESPDTYPLQKKGHSPEFLRSIAHLRPRTNLYGAIMRTRSRLAASVHRFFLDRDFVWVHTPLITASDCEGAGEMFRVTTLNPANPVTTQQANYATDFFGKATYLTVSGQLEAETFACALSNVYTFGPTFRAENSNTTRHAAEFWMIEPEIAFCDLAGDMDIAEAFVKHLINDMLDNNKEDMAFFNQFIDKTLLTRLEAIVTKPFIRCSYTEAVAILEKSGHPFSYPVSWGINLQSEHERYLTEEHFKCPVIVYNYPAAIKPFYMRLNDDGKTVTAMDVLVPGIGEIVGGSQREERLDILLANMRRLGLSEEAYWWYVDLRRFGSVPHAGFGAGFERLIMFITGVSNIRDVLPYPRTPNNCEF